MSKESSLKASFWDGVFASAMLGLTANYTTPFALVLGATNFHIGLLNSIPLLLSSLVQLWSTEIGKKAGSRVKFITQAVFLQAAAFIGICLIFLIPKHFQIKTFIVLVAMIGIFGSVSTPVWAALMSDTVDKNQYGRYFAWRGKVLGFVGLVSSFSAGFFLFIYPNKLVGFIILFVLAGLCRVISGIWLGRMDDIPLVYSPEKQFSYRQFIKRFAESNFVRFVFFVALINFATFLAAPFFAVYMLEELGFKYSTYTIVNTAGALAGLISLPFWGKLADRYGNARIIKSSAKFLPLLPIFWLFSKNPIHLAMVNAIAGYVWAGFNLSVINFIFDISSREARTRCVAYFNVTNGIFIFLGAFIGGYLATHLSGMFFGSALLTLFFISGIARFLVSIFIAGKFREVREVEKIKDKEMLYIVLGITTALSLGEGIYRRKS